MQNHAHIWVGAWRRGKLTRMIGHIGIHTYKTGEEHPGEGNEDEAPIRTQLVRGKCSDELSRQEGRVKLIPNGKLVIKR